MSKKEKLQLVIYICILTIICIMTFLVAKYIVRKNISKDEIPIDTSTRLE